MNPALPPLPERLRLATRELHAAAERSGVMAELVQGRLAWDGYRRLLADLLALYSALEAALDANAAQAWAAGLSVGPLRRAPALQADLGQPLPEPSAAVADYVARLHRLGTDGDPRLLAHVYTRYPGDLHGGQILQALVQRRYPAQSTHFMDFGSADEVQAQRLALREALATAPLSPAQADAVVTEACWSFEQHRHLFEALAAH